MTTVLLNKIEEQKNTKVKILHKKGDYSSCWTNRLTKSAKQQKQNTSRIKMLKMSWKEKITNKEILNRLKTMMKFYSNLKIRC